MTFKYPYPNFARFAVMAGVLADLGLTVWGLNQFFRGDVTHGLLALAVAGIGALYSQSERLHGGLFS